MAWPRGKWRNRLLLEDAYPLALAPAAVAVADATVTLNRVTILGRLAARRLRATDSIVHGFAVVEDTEEGCVRYSAVLSGSRLPPQQDSAELSSGSAVFTSTVFGRPGYGQLLETADRAVVRSGRGTTLLAGSTSGTQMGSFSGAGRAHQGSRTAVEVQRIPSRRADPGDRPCHLSGRAAAYLRKGEGADHGQ